MRLDSLTQALLHFHFGGEFVAMKTAIKQVEGLCHKLCMMGILVDGSKNVFVTMIQSVRV